MIVRIVVSCEGWDLYFLSWHAFSMRDLCIQRTGLHAGNLFVCTCMQGLFPVDL